MVLAMILFLCVGIGSGPCHLLLMVSAAGVARSLREIMAERPRVPLSAESSANQGDTLHWPSTVGSRFAPKFPLIFISRDTLCILDGREGGGVGVGVGRDGG